MRIKYRNTVNETIEAEMEVSGHLVGRRLDSITLSYEDMEKLLSITPELRDRVLTTFKHALLTKKQRNGRDS